MAIKDINKIRKVATKAAKEAGEELLKRYQKFDRSNIKLKSARDIVTAADLAAEKIILDKIKKSLPDHAILSEESGSNNQDSDYLWIVDPLDGTTNFSFHNPIWAVSIGVAYKGKVVFGVVYCPIHDEIFVAEKGNGARMNGKKIKVSNIKSGKVLNTYCHASDERSIKKAVQYLRKQKIDGFDCRQLGSAATELAYTACGRVESIVIPGAHPWDVAAGILLVKEAGGKVTDFDGRQWSLKSPDMAASNGKVHTQIMKIL